MTAHSDRDLEDILRGGDWAWFRYHKPDGKKKEWAIRVHASASCGEIVERRYGASIAGEAGAYHMDRPRAGRARHDALKVARKKHQQGYTLLGGSPDLRMMSGDTPAQRSNDDSESSEPVDEMVFARFSGKGQSAFDELSQALTTAAEEVEHALAHAGQRPPEVVIGHSPYSTVILFGAWVFSIIRDTQRATHRGNQVELKQGSVRGAAMVQPAQGPLAVALWLARVQHILAGRKGRLDLVDDDGRAIDPSFRDEAILLGEWGCDFETLRPALEYLELVEQKLDLGALQAPVADNWF